MAKQTRTNLQSRTTQARNETLLGANTALRVFQLVLDLLSSTATDFDPTLTYQNGEWAIWQGRLVQAFGDTEPGQSPQTHPAKWVDNTIGNATQIAENGPDYPVRATALRTYVTQRLNEVIGAGGDIPFADEQRAGIVRRATQALADAGLDNSTFVTPAILKQITNALAETVFGLYLLTSPQTGQRIAVNVTSEGQTRLINVDADTLQAVMARPGGNITDQDYIVRPGNQQRGFYWQEQVNGTWVNRLFIGRRANGTLAILDLTNNVSLTSEPGADGAPGKLTYNGDEVATVGQLGGGTATPVATQPLPGVTLILGASWAYGTGSSLVNTTPNGYIRQAIARSGLPNDSLTYINQAVPGSYTDYWLEKDTSGLSRTERLIRDNRPEFVYFGLSLGNEFNSDDHPAAQDRYFRNLTQLVAIARRYAARVIVGSWYPRYGYSANDYRLLKQGLLKLDTLNVASVNLCSLLDAGDGSLLASLRVADPADNGLHPNDQGHAELAYTIPKDYFSTRSPQGFPLALDPITRGVRITAASARPLCCYHEARSLTLAMEVRLGPDAVGTGKALAYFGDANTNPLRLRLRSEAGAVQLSYDGDGGVRQNIATSVALLSTTTWLHVAVTINLASQQARLYVNGHRVGQGSIPPGVYCSPVTFFSNPADAGVVALGYDARNITIHAAPLYDEQVSLLASGKVPTSSLLVFCPCAEESLFKDMRLINRAGYSTTVLSLLDGGVPGVEDTGSPTPTRTVVVGDLYEYVANTAPQATEVSREITGSASISEGTTKNYKLIRHLSDGTSSDATSQADWSLVNPVTGDTIAANGDLTIPANQTTADSRSLTIKARDKNTGVETTLSVQVIDATQIVEVDRQIIGDSSITEGQTKSYSLRLQMSDGSYVYPQSGVVWSDQTPASGETLTQGGQLSIAANQTTNDTHFKTIRTTYGGLTKDKVIQVLDATTPPPTRTAITINGGSSINEGAQGIYTVTATLSNGQTESVPNSQIVWQTANDNGRTVIDGNGLLTAYSNAVAGDGLTFQVKAFVDSLTASKNVQLVDTTVVTTPTRTAITVNGPSSVDEGSFADYTVTATKSDSTTETVPNSEITWQLVNGVAGDSLSAAGRLSVASNSVLNDGHTVGAKATVGSLTNTKTVTVVDKSVAPVVPSITGVWRRFDGNNINYWVRGENLTSAGDYAVQYRHYVPVVGSDGIATYQWVGNNSSFQFRAPSTAPTNLTSAAGGDVYANVGYGQYYPIEFRIVSVTTGLPYDSAVYRFGEWTGESGTADSALRVYPDPYGLTATSPGRGAGRSSDNPGFDVNNQNTSTDTTPDVGAVNS